LIFTFQSVHATDVQLQIAEQGQITDRYYAAISDLGSPSADVRLGAIYALQRIMQDSPRDQPAVVAVLCAFVRDHAKITNSNLARPAPPADIQGALTVVVTRDTAYDSSATVVDFSGTDLEGAQLADADLTGVDLAGATLDFADLQDASLERANLTNAFLGNTDLSGADLTAGDLAGAYLEGAAFENASMERTVLGSADFDDSDFVGADLAKADFTDTDLRGAAFEGADFAGAVGLRPGVYPLTPAALPTLLAQHPSSR
jgi:hypothetical protein